MDSAQLRSWKEASLARLERYVRVDTTARPDVPSPSSQGQVELGRQVVDELCGLGLRDVDQDQHGIVTTTLPPSPGREGAPTLGLLAHLDTSPEAPGCVKATRVIRSYDGGPISFGAAPGLTISPETLPELGACLGHDLLLTDGSSLLGADDKAGIAAIVTAVEHLLRHPEIAHGRLRLAFTSDEEIGQGIKHLDLGAFGADVAYTLDDDATGTIAAETFSADQAVVRVIGRNTHPGTAKGQMVSAIKVLGELIAALPRDQAPEATEGRQGFLHPYDLRGTVAEAQLKLLVRDFDTPVLDQREGLLRGLLGDVLRRYPGATGQVAIVKQYRNMADALRQRPEVVTRAEAAIRRVGLEPKRTEIRGGTDGSQLTERGLPCPNLFTGWHNAHAISEWCCLDDLALSVATLVELAKEWATA